MNKVFFRLVRKEEVFQDRSHDALRLTGGGVKMLSFLISDISFLSLFEGSWGDAGCINEAQLKIVSTIPVVTHAETGQSNY